MSSFLHEALPLSLCVMGDHIVDAYSNVGRVIVLYVAIIVSLSLPHCVLVRALSKLIVLFAFTFVLFMCSVKVRCGSRVRPRIFGFLTVGILLLFMVRLSSVLCSCVSGVKRVAVDLSELSCRSFCFVQVYISFR